MIMFPEGLDSEPFFRLLEELNDYAYVKNTKCEFLFSNSAHLRLMGLNQIQGKTDFDFVLPFLAMQFQQQEKEVLQGEPLMKPVEILSKDGHHSPQQKKRAIRGNINPTEYPLNRTF